MHRDDLIRRIGRNARERGVRWALIRQGGNHEIWRCGTTTVPIPRHEEISEQVARTILRELDVELGKDWWR
jgi:hypothetical protein